MSSSSSADAECCENCSSNFGIFKRKKVCNMCNQAFCQFCVNRRNSCENSVPTTTATDSNANDRICVICRSICSPHTTSDDLMKLKLKHLKSFLTHANIPIGTCKDKRDLAELIMRNHEKFRFREAPAPPPSGQQNNQTPNTSGGNQFNNTINNFMSNVQDFVNFNLGSVLNPNNNANNVGGNPNANNNNNNSNSQPPPQAQAQQQQQQPNYTIPSNFNSVFNLIGEQLPNVIQSTLGNNLFNFSGASTAGNAPHGSSSTNARTGSTSDSDTANNRQSSRSNEQRQQTSRNESQPQPPRSEAASNFPSSSAPSTANVKRRPSLSDLKNEEAIEDLSVKQLKELLALNFVEFKGCCERRELIEKARRLYRSHQENKMREQELNNQGSSVHGATSDYSASENDVCKICMESLIDCVLLDCGHMVSCIKCGKQLAECPICRQNVVRVVRVFKS